MTTPSLIFLTTVEFWHWLGDAKLDPVLLSYLGCYMAMLAVHRPYKWGGVKDIQTWQNEALQ